MQHDRDIIIKAQQSIATQNAAAEVVSVQTRAATMSAGSFIQARSRSFN